MPADTLVANTPVTEALAPDALVECVGLTKTYRGSSSRALDGLSLTVPRGSFFGLLGPNGAGKTTLIAILCGLVAPDAGKVVSRQPIGLVPQELAFYPTLTVEENLAYFAAMHRLDRTRRAERIEYSIAIGRLEAVRKQRAGTLSGGLKRRLNLAIGVLAAPALLVLDEPTVGVDAQSRRHLHESLRRLNAAGTTVIYTSHYLDEVQHLCDRLAVIDHGRLIAQGPTRSLLRQNAVTLRTHEVVDAAVMQALQALPAVTSVRQDTNLIALITEERERTLSAALEVMKSSGVAVQEAGFGAQSLEALFFQLTGTHLRSEEQDEVRDQARNERDEPTAAR